MIKERASVTITPELLQKIDNYAKEHQLSRSAVVEQGMNSFLSSAKKYDEEYYASGSDSNTEEYYSDLVKKYVQSYLLDGLKKYAEEYYFAPLEKHLQSYSKDLVKKYAEEYYASLPKSNTLYYEKDSDKRYARSYPVTSTNSNTQYYDSIPTKKYDEEYYASQSNRNTQISNTEPDYVNDPDAWSINQNCERGYIIPRMPLTWDEYKTNSDWYFASDYWWQNEPSAHPFMSQTLDAQQSAAECCGYLVWGSKGPHKPFNQIELQMLKFAETKPEIQERCFAATGWRPVEQEEHIPQTLQHIELPEIEETPLTSEQEELMERVKKVAEKKNCGMFEAWDLQHENEFFIPEEWELMEKKYMQDTTPLNLFVNIAVKDHLLANESMCRDLIKFLRERYPLCESWKMLEVRAEEGSFTISDLCEELIRCGDSVNPLPEISF